MAGTIGTRLWRVHKAAGRSWPVLDDDDVIDFMIMEAVALKSAKEDNEQEQQAERKNWRKDSGGLDKLREIAN